MMGILITFVSLIGFASRWAFTTWGDIDMDEIVFHLQNPLEGTGNGMIGIHRPDHSIQKRKAASALHLCLSAAYHCGRLLCQKHDLETAGYGHLDQRTQNIFHIY